MSHETDNRPICCWISQTQLEHFRAIARANNVSPSAYLKAMIVDVLAEESGRVPVPRRKLLPDIFALLRKKDIADVREA